MRFLLSRRGVLYILGQASNNIRIAVLAGPEIYVTKVKCNAWICY